jgi:AcrR family transcriptional regulator
MRGWGREDEPSNAAERLLDAAREVFLRKGVVDVTVADVAEAAGCARGTVYRCFPDRDALRSAFVDREARRVGTRIAARVAGTDDPRRCLVEAVVAAIEEVRADPVLAAWFTEASAATAGRIAVGTSVIRELVGSFLAHLSLEAERQDLHRPDVDVAAVGEGAVRLVLSLLAHPDPAGPAAERRIVENLVVPAVFRTDEASVLTRPG